MRIGHQISILVLVSAFGGLALAFGVGQGLRQAQALHARTQGLDTLAARAESDRVQFEKLLAHWLLSGDLVLNNQVTYMVEFETLRANEVHERLYRFSVSPFVGKEQAAAFGTCMQLVSEMDADIRLAATTSGPKRVEVIGELVRVVDGRSALLLEQLEGLIPAMNAQVIEQTPHSIAALLAKRRRVLGLLWGTTALYLAVVLALWVWTRHTVVDPLNLLTNMTNEAARNPERAFDIAEAGPVEVRQLTRSVAGFVETLKARQGDLKLANRELGETMCTLNTRNCELEEASRHKSEFLAATTHELRTPLNAIIGYLALSLRSLAGTLPTKRLRQLTNAQLAARKLLGQINNILDFSKIEAGFMEVRLEPLDLRLLVEEVLITGRGLTTLKTVVVSADLPEGPILVYSDPIRLRQILNNLLGNAVKATSEGLVQIRIRKRLPEAYEIAVVDTGCGIPADQIGAIFDTFRQVDGSLKKKLDGTGLGLAIVRNLCDLLGIEIAVSSQEGVGTTMLLCIPRPPIGAKLPCQGVGQAIQSRARVAATSPVDVAQASVPVLLCLGGQALTRELSASLVQQPVSVEQVTGADAWALGTADRSVLGVVIEANWLGVRDLLAMGRDARLHGVPKVLCSSVSHFGSLHLDWPPCVPGPIGEVELVNLLLGTVRPPELGRVLVIESDRATRDIYGGILTDAGFNAVPLAGGEEVLTALRRGPLPQNALFDLGVDDLDALGVKETRHGCEAWRGVPVLLLCGETLRKAEFRQHAESPLRTQGQLGMNQVMRAVTQLGDCLRLLVIDDNDMNLALMTEILEQEQCEVHTASSAVTGIALAERVQPDVILMDLAMPEMDGLEATQRLKANPVTASITVLACSALSVKDYRGKALAAGCEGFIAKPIDPDNLATQVRGLVLASHVRRLHASGVHVEG